MTARAEVLRRDLDLNALGEAARAAVDKQKRGMIRGLTGLAALVGLCVALYALTGKSQILVPAIGLIGVCAYALAADLGRLALTRRWGEQAPHLDPSAARRERMTAVVKLAGAVSLAVLASFLPETLAQILWLVGLVGLLHYAFVLRTLTREIHALRD